jgi:urate oxidase
MPHQQSMSYGESRLRMLRVLRRGDRHDPKDLTIALRLEGDAAAIVPGEAIKNLVHRIARDEDHPAIETLALSMCARILAAHGRVRRVRVDIVEQPWARLEAGGKPQGQAFTPAGVERRTVTVTGNATQTAITAGLDNLVLLRTSGFVPSERGHAIDEPAADGLQRLFIASLSARWSFASGDIAFAAGRQGVRAAILETFAWHTGPSARETLSAIAEVVLESYQEISEVTLTLQERPYRPVDLLELSLDGDVLFVAHEEPVGTIEITVARDPGLR